MCKETQPPVKRSVKRKKLWRESYAKIMLLYSAPAWVCIASTQQLVKQLWVTLPCTFRTYAVVVFHAVHLRQFVHSSCLGARLWLDHDVAVIFDGQADDVRTIWPIEHGFLLLHERDPSSKLHLVLSFSLSRHGQLVSWCFKPSQTQRII